MNLKTVFFLVLISMAGAATAKSGLVDESFSIALPRVLTHCEVPVELSNDLHQVNSGGSISINSIAAVSAYRQLSLVLVADEYEVYFGGATLGDGGDLVGPVADGAPIHIILNRNNASEHFLFSLNADGSGELLWASEAASTLTRCSAVPVL